ncbi:MAG: alanine racemase [Nitrospirae bacterium]|nr:alanine racemase [Nitrospirota bacterium]
MQRGAFVEIDLSCLSYNIRKIKRLIGKRPIIAVVKADAYGHGAVEVSKTIVSEGIKHLGVAFLNEAIELRESGIKEEILVFFDQDISQDIIDYQLTPVINSLSYARYLNKLAEKNRLIVRCHINIDTGMGRMGINSDNAYKAIREIIELKNLRVTGIMSHFSDADLADRCYAEEQVEQLKLLRNKLLKVLPKGCMFHIANSAATVALPEAYFDAVRPGLILYGVNPFSSAKFRPVMTVKARILSIRKLKKGTSISYGRTFITSRDTKVGVLAIGYADGLLRSTSNRAYFLVKGERAPVVGRVCMDLTIVDLTEIKGVKEGDEVVILGAQGDGDITSTELAESAGTIPYEILTSLGKTNRRFYKNSESNS